MLSLTNCGDEGQPSAKGQKPMMFLRLSLQVLGMGGAVVVLARCGQQLIADPRQSLVNQGRPSLSRDLTSPGYKVLYSFGGYPTDGVTPEASLIAVNGTLYGTTSGGGSGCYPSGGCGTVFSFKTSGDESILYSFTGAKDGALPYAGLTNANGVLYGTTAGGASSGGTVFSITTVGRERVLHYFGGTRDGADPHASLIEIARTLYGTTVFGGSLQIGTVFQITRSRRETVLHSFSGTRVGADGKYPAARLLNLNGILYGTTYKGGAMDRGTVFKITRSGKESVLYSFKGGANDGAYPLGGLTYVKSAFYGTTSGGSNACKGCFNNPGDGTIFRITPSGTESLVYKFKNYPSDGAVPRGDLLYRNGTFYGTTEYGGANCAVSYGCGTIFSSTPSGSETMLYSFQPSEGAYPVAGLIDLNGTFYGTTSSGGAYRRGTIFSLSVPNK
jgi:uncharacterized repeat protein (TIGR03803 family)